MKCYLIELLSRSCDAFVSKNFATLIFGDLNCNMMLDSSLDDLCDVYGLSNLVKNPTCFTSTPSLLDVFLTEKPKSFAGILNCDVGISDFHNIVCVATRINAPNANKRQIIYRSLKDFNEELFILKKKHGK